MKRLGLIGLSSPRILFYSHLNLAGGDKNLILQIVNEEKLKNNVNIFMGF